MPWGAKRHVTHKHVTDTKSAYETRTVSNRNSVRVLLHPLATPERMQLNNSRHHRYFTLMNTPALMHSLRMFSKSAASFRDRLCCPYSTICRSFALPDLNSDCAQTCLDLHVPHTSKALRVQGSLFLSRCGQAKTRDPTTSSNHAQATPVPARCRLVFGLQFGLAAAHRTGLFSHALIKCESITSIPPLTDVWSRRSPAQSESDLTFRCHGNDHTAHGWDRRYRPKRFTNSVSLCFGQSFAWGSGS